MLQRGRGQPGWVLALCAGLVFAFPGVSAAIEGFVGDLVGVAGATVGMGTGDGGGSNTTYTTSTTHHTTYTRKDLPAIQAFQTEVTGVLGGNTVFDQTVPDAPDSAAVHAAEDQASAALQAGGAGTITGPTQVCASQTSETAFLGNQPNHTEQTVTTTASLGPGTILIGDDQSQTFFVQAGTTNYNTNTHTETFTDQVFQTKVTNRACEQLSADPADPARAAPLVAGRAVTAPAAPAPAPAPPVPAQPKVTG